MLRNLPALPKFCRALPLLLLLALGVPAETQEADISGELEETGIPAPDFVESPLEEPLPAPRWFRSNPAGMALEEASSRLAALRNEYALALDYLPPGELPEILAPYHRSPWRVEVHILYKRGGESRRQWIFRDPSGAARLVAVFNQDLLNPPEEEAEPAGLETEDGEAAEEETEETEGGEENAGAGAEAEAAPVRVLTGFIESYNEDGQIITDHLFLDGGEESITDFTYRSRRLIRAEMRRKIQADEGEQILPVFTDLYRYNRAASLRAVERIYHEGAETDSPVRLSFPHMVLNAAADKNFVSPGAFRATGFPEDYSVGEGYRVLYTTDARGRILTETRQDDQGKVLAELVNTWSGERLASVVLKSGDDERLTEYDYNNEGDRITERNYRNGVLERVVRGDGNREVEELYMNGAVILRAIWEDGRKISEERVRPIQR
jgi:hypothetical protein